MKRKSFSSMLIVLSSRNASSLFFEVVVDFEPDLDDELFDEDVFFAVVFVEAALAAAEGALALAVGGTSAPVAAYPGASGNASTETRNPVLAGMAWTMRSSADAPLLTALSPLETI
jgi:hypothetical protein